MKWLWLWVLLLTGIGWANPGQHCDVLLVVAHPDDETMVSGLLARLVFDRHKTVGVVYGTRGNGGTNANGPESARALGLERDIEARQALATLGIDHVWSPDLQYICQLPKHPGSGMERDGDNEGSTRSGGRGNS